MAKPKSIRTLIPFPAAIRREIERLAKEDGRSMAGFIRFHMLQVIKQRKRAA